MIAPRREARPTPAVEAVPTARDVEAQGQVARRGTEIEPVREVAPVAVDAAGSRSARRQPADVLQPGHRHADECRHRGLRRRRLRRLPVAHGDRWVRSARRGGQARRHPLDDPHRGRVLLCAGGADMDHRVPARCDPQGACGLRREHRGRDGGRRHRRALPEVPASRVPRAVVRHQWLVRVPLPRLAVQPSRREEGRPRPPRHGPVPHHDRQQRRGHRRHGHDRDRPSDRHEHDRSGGRGPALHHGRW